MKHSKKLLMLSAPVMALGIIGSPVNANPTDAATNEEYICDASQIATGIIRPAMVDRETTISVKYASELPMSYYEENFSDGVEGYLFDDSIFEHTSVPVEGDYLKWQYSGWNATVNYNDEAESGMYLYDITYTVNYYTTAEQEAAVSAAVDSFISSNIAGKELSDGEKAQIIYDYICSTVSYGGDDMKYTCYGALIDNAAVCQGYSLLFYRLALESGLDARLIAGTNHGWNIVRIDDCYYNVDATLDAGLSADTYQWFLKCNSTFMDGSKDHTRLTAYNSAEFNAKYEMSETDYNQTSIMSPGITGVRPVTDIDESATIVSFDMAQILRECYLTRPQYYTIIGDLPDTAVVSLSDGRKISIPVEWECLGEYDSVPVYFYYEFDIKTDSLPYRVDPDAIIPYAGIFIGSDGITVDSVTGRTNETIIANYLLSELDCNNATVAGILANIYSESGFNPTASVLDTNSKISYGICQWNGSRFDSLRNYCANRGMDYTTLNGQLNYLKHELTNVSPYTTRWANEIKQYDNSADAAYTAGYQWAARFEVCATRYREGRARLARDTYWPEYANYVYYGTRLVQLPNGAILLYIDGVPQYNYYGIYKDAAMGYKYLEGGYVNTTYNDLYNDSRLGMVKVINGGIDTAYNELYCSPTFGWWKVKNGFVDKDFSDLYCSPIFGWWKIEKGSIDFDYNDLYYSPTLGWWKIVNGTIDFTYSDLYCSPTMGWWKVSFGALDLAYNDLYYSPVFGWWKVEFGTINFDYTDLYYSPTMGWWKIYKGTIDFTYNDLYCSPTMGWWKVAFGSLDFAYTDLYYSDVWGWWKINGGTIDSAYTDLYCSPTMGWWKIVNGTIDFPFTDLYCSPTMGWWKIVNGTIDFAYDEVYCSPVMGWWKVSGGCIDFYYTDFYKSNNLGWCKILGGKFDSDYSDIYYSKSIYAWLVKDGLIDFSFTGYYDSPQYGRIYVSCGQVTD